MFQFIRECTYTNATVEVLTNETTEKSILSFMMLLEFQYLDKFYGRSSF